MSNEITDAERLDFIMSTHETLTNRARIDAAILAERKPVVERSTWQNEGEKASSSQYHSREAADRVAFYSNFNRIAVLRRDFWSNGDVTCDLEGL